jgi:hypothetical protein
MQPRGFLQHGQHGGFSPDRREPFLGFQALLAVNLLLDATDYLSNGYKGI